jgi:chorismate synthase
MAGNSFGSLFRITTFGESHGPAVGVVIDGVRPNLPFSLTPIQAELNRRRPGQSKVTTPRNETDQVQVLSGVFKGKTLGTPICLLVWNRDQNSAAYDKIKDLFRPGHAGFTYLTKYGIHDYRGGGRSSGRETIGRVAAGALAKQLLAKEGIRIVAYTKSVGNISVSVVDEKEIEKNPVRCPDRAAARRMEKRILSVQKQGDSLGGVVEAVVHGCPAGLGEPVFDKLEADLAKALLSIPAIRGFEIGAGFASSGMKGSENNDAFVKSASGRIRTKTNNAGGILGGISNGEDIVVRVAVKPPSSIPKEQATVDVRGRKRTISVTGRHDPCLCPRVVPVVESMVSLVIADHLLRQRMISDKRNVSAVRRQIDYLDEMMTIILSQRGELVRQVGAWKKKHNVRVPDPKREKQILARRLSTAEEAGMSVEFIRDLYEVLFRYAKKEQSEM